MLTLSNILVVREHSPKSLFHKVTVRWEESVFYQGNTKDLGMVWHRVHGMAGSRCEGPELAQLRNIIHSKICHSNEDILMKVC